MEQEPPDLLQNGDGIDDTDADDLEIEYEEEEETEDMYNGRGDGYDYDPPQQPAHNSRVKVEDALTYLDQVKTQFASEPHVYTQFLDIMKDFKSQTIDTPGVILRVSSLFAGKPHLITGFNQFLPAGFEVAIDGERIIISEPTGVRKLIQNGEVIEIPMIAYDAYMGMEQAEDEEEVEDEEEEDEAEDEDEEEGEAPEYEDIPDEEEEEPEEDAASIAEASIDEPVEEDEEQLIPAPEVSEDPYAAGRMHAVNQSIRFVNKIKSRFENRQYVYHEFLMILQEFQNRLAVDQSEEAILDAVTELFDGEMDLLEEFRLFLPSIHGLYQTPPPAEEEVPEGEEEEEEDEEMEGEHELEESLEEECEEEEEDEEQVESSSSSSEGEEVEEEESSEDEEEVKETDDGSMEVVQLVQDTEEEPGHAMELEETPAEVLEDSDLIVDTDLLQTSFSSESEAEEAEDEEEEESEGESGEEADLESDEDDIEVANFQMPSIRKETDAILQIARVEDMAFFERIRRKCSEVQYDTFLRALATYNTGILSAQELLTILVPIIGGFDSLLNEFNRRFLARDHGYVSAAMDSLSEEQKHNIDYATCKQLGVSYRSLPKNMNPPRCSGRTPLCQTVLNDTWVSFPSWLSEDTTVVSVKKTPYEEFVCKTEDERFELDIIIENNKYAIDALETVRRKMSRMSTHELERFDIGEKLGGSSATLMTRAIKRIYGENAAKVIESLRRNTVLTVPKIIDRMKDKERDWVDAQEQMNKVWKEQNDRYMAKSLDHQSNAMKTSDAKWIKAKQLVHQMETLFDERQTKFVEGRSDDEGPHMMISYPEDKSVLRDVSELIIHHVNRQTAMPQIEKDRMKFVLRRYLSEFFFVPCYMGDTSDDEEEENMPIGRENDDDVKLFGTNRYRTVYGGNALLVFLRVHHMLCERLARVKTTWREINAMYEMDEKIQEERKRIYLEQGKEKVLAHEMNVSDMNNGLPELRSNGQKRLVPALYDDLLLECKNLLDGTVDATVFEDQIRTLFPLDAYMVFSIDKMVSLAARQLHLLALNNDNAECLKMYDRYKVNPPFSLHDNSDQRAGIEQEYSNEAETKLNCQNCFKVLLMDLPKVTVTIELIDTETEELSLDGPDVVGRAISEAGTSDEDNEEEEEPMEIEKRDEPELPAQETVREEVPAQPSTSRKEVKEEPEPPKKAPLFLNRNVSLRKHIGLDQLAKEISQCSGTFSVRAEKVRLAAHSFEGFLKQTKPRGERLKNALDKMARIRKSRAERVVNLSNVSSERTWLDSGCTRMPVTHPFYQFLQYNQYHLNDLFY